MALQQHSFHVSGGAVGFVWRYRSQPVLPTNIYTVLFLENRPKKQLIKSKTTLTS